MPNATNSSATVSAPIASLPTIYAWFLFTIFISIIGAVASILLISVIFKQDAQRLRSSLLICQMLFLNFFMTAVYAPTDTIITFRYQLGYRDRVSCDAVAFFRQTNLGATHWLSCAVALNRLVAAVFPHQHKSMFSVKNTIGYIMICLLVPAAVNTLTVSGVAGRVFLALPLGICGSESVLPPLFIFLNTFLVISFPLSVQGLAHVVLAIKLTRKGHGRAEHPAVSAKRQRQVVLARVLIVSYVWYIICFLPIPIIKPIVNITGFYVGYEMMLLWLKTVIFFMLGTDYQVTLKKMLHGHRVSQSGATIEPLQFIC